MSPDLTIAAIVENGGKFLMIEEKTSSGPKINHPSGHVEEGENLLNAMIREAFEEAAYDIEPLNLIGIYQWRNSKKSLDCLRIAISGRVVSHHLSSPLDEGIIRVMWMTHEEICTTAAHHRSPLVLLAVEDYLAGRRYPLDILNHVSILQAGSDGCQL